MELHELKSFIDSALDDCQNIIGNNTNVVLSEADLERLLANCISRCINEDIENPQNDSFSVHTQISHYMDDHSHVDKRVDILLLKESMLELCTKHKGYKYLNDSFALELKYLRPKDHVDIVRCDFCKRRVLESNSWLYVVVLIGYSDEKDLIGKSLQIANMAKETYQIDKEYHDNLFFRVLKKKCKQEDDNK